MKPKCVQSWHGRISAISQMWRTLYSTRLLVTSIRIAKMTKTPGQWKVICVPVIECLIVILNVEVVQVNLKRVHHVKAQQESNMESCSIC